MNAIDRFDRSLVDALDDLAAPTYPEYFDDALKRATRGAQRPSWTFVERWIPMTSTTRRPMLLPSLPMAPLLLLFLLLAVVLATVMIGVGGLFDRSPVPPYGPAGNGDVVYSSGGDIYARQLAGGEARLLVGGPGEDVAPLYSPDGTRIAFFRLTEGSDTLFVTAADGTEARELLGGRTVAWASWGPDSRSMAVISFAGGDHTLSVVDAEAGTNRIIDLPVQPEEGVEWRPSDGRELVFRGSDGPLMAIYGVRPDGTGFRQISQFGNGDAFWAPYAMSPDGSQLMYTLGGDTVSIHLLDLDTEVDRVWGAAMPPPEPGYSATEHWGSPVFSPDGSQIAFGRYWDEREGTINHQIFVASVESDGADAVAIADIHRSKSGHGPFEYAWAPDGTSVIVRYNDIQQMWLADPAGAEAQRLEWGVLNDPPSWQRVEPD